MDRFGYSLGLRVRSATWLESLSGVLALPIDGRWDGFAWKGGRGEHGWFVVFFWGGGG